MAPEQVRNAKAVDVRSDIYSLAHTLYMMVTGEPPVGLLPPGPLVPELSERADRAIRRALQPAPTLRPASCLEFLADLVGSWEHNHAAPREA